MSVSSACADCGDGKARISGSVRLLASRAEGSMMSSGNGQQVKSNSRERSPCSMMPESWTMAF